MTRLQITIWSKNWTAFLYTIWNLCCIFCHFCPFSKFVLHFLLFFKSSRDILLHFSVLISDCMDIFNPFFPLLTQQDDWNLVTLKFFLEKMHSPTELAFKMYIPRCYLTISNRCIHIFTRFTQVLN